MQSLQKPCQSCHKPMNGGVYRASHLCPHCFFEHEGGKASKRASLAKAMASSVKIESTPSDLAEKSVVVNAEVTKTGEDKPISNVQTFSSTIPNNDGPSLDVPAIKPEIATSKGAVVQKAVAQKKESAIQKVDVQQAKTALQPKQVEQKAEQKPMQGKSAQQQKPVKQDLPPVKKTATVKPLPFEEPKLDVGKRVRAQADQPIALNTKPVSDQNVVAILDDITAECVLNVELTPDLFTKGKFTGAKSEKIKAALLQGKKNALAALRDKARDMDANMVAGIAIKNSMKAVDEKTAANVTVKASGVALIVEVAGEALEA